MHVLRCIQGQDKPRREINEACDCLFLNAGKVCRRLSLAKSLAFSQRGENRCAGLTHEGRWNSEVADMLRKRIIRPAPAFTASVHTFFQFIQTFTTLLP